MDTSIVAMRHNDTTIAFDASKHVWNLTDLWRAAGSPQGKEVWRWAETEQARGYLQALKENLVQNEVLETRQGRNGGTWAHELAGLEYARYLSPELSIACNQFILDSQRQPAAPALSREDVRAIAQEEMQAHAPRLQYAQPSDILILDIYEETMQALQELGGRARLMQIARKMQRKKTTVIGRLQRMKEHGVVRQVRVGLYELIPDMVEYRNN